MQGGVWEGKYNRLEYREREEGSEQRNRETFREHTEN